MHSFTTVKEVADFLHDKAVGTKCQLTGGGKSKDGLRARVMRYGIRVKVAGDQGDRTIELTAAFSQTLKDQKKTPQNNYWTRDLSPNTTEYPLNLAVGAAATVHAANGKALRNWVTQHYGPWTCTVRKAGQAGDWIVTRLSAKPAPAKFVR